MQIIPVILSGGSGTRLWPLFRKQYPKQYLPLAGDKIMLQETILRLNGLDNSADPSIICNTGPYLDGTANFFKITKNYLNSWI
jgi:mannose-1-phosphate guanylyltransferase